MAKHVVTTTFETRLSKNMSKFHLQEQNEDSVHLGFRNTFKIFGSCSSDCFDISDPSCNCVSVQCKIRGILISVSIDFYVLQLCPDQDGLELLQLDARSDQRVNPGGHFPVGFRHHPATEG